MPTRDEPWPDGRPCWVDCQVDDPGRAREFYSELFGWEIPDLPPEAGGYLIALKDGRAAAGIGPKPPGVEGMPSMWTTYFASADADRTAAAVRDAGGTVLMEPFDVLDSGRMTVATDPSGAAFGVWEARGHIGAGVYEEPGSLCWTDLHSRDYETAQKFLAGVFGFTFEEIGDGQGLTYSTFTLAGGSDSVGGVMRDTMMPDGMPDYWLAWFGVQDCDAALAKAQEFGSTVLMGPESSPFGRIGVIAAPQGEILGLIDMTTTAGPPPGSRA